MAIKPKLKVTQVRETQNGPMETVMVYSKK